MKKNIKIILKKKLFTVTFALPIKNNKRLLYKLNVNVEREAESVKVFFCILMRLL